MKYSVTSALIAIPAALYPLLNSSTALAQSPALVDVCTGLRVSLPVLTPVTGILDPLLSGLINTNLTSVLSGQTIGVRAFDGGGNLISTPDCGVSVGSVTVDANAGVALGGGVMTGLGGTANPQASAGEANSIAIGNGATTMAGALNSIAFGLRGSVSAADGVALGRDTSVTATGGVAIGAGSAAGRTGMNGGLEAFSGASVSSAAGALSVGSAGSERQITNVAGGTQDTDAVNLRQLRAVNDRAMQTVTTALGGGSSYDSTTNVFIGPSYTLRGNTYNDVGLALAALDGEIGGAGTGGAVAGNNSSGLPNASATGADGTALGYDAHANHAKSTAIGTGASTTRDGQIMIGTASNTYTMPGITSAASRANQVGSTRVLTSDAYGNIASADVDLNQMGSDIATLQKDTAQLRRESRQGIAAAMAMASVPTPSAPGKTAWSTNVAAFKGEMATSFAIAHTFDMSYPVTMNASVGYAPGGAAGVRMGLSGEF